MSLSTKTAVAAAAFAAVAAIAARAAERKVAPAPAFTAKQLTELPPGSAA